MSGANPMRVRVNFNITASKSQKRNTSVLFAKHSCTRHRRMTWSIDVTKKSSPTVDKRRKQNKLEPAASRVIVGINVKRIGAGSGLLQTRTETTLLDDLVQHVVKLRISGVREKIADFEGRHRIPGLNSGDLGNPLALLRFSHVDQEKSPEILIVRNMGRGKLPQGLIPNARARRTAYEKRKKCLMKKAREFSVLCDVDTCVVVFPEASTAPEVWPPDSVEARRIIERYRSAGSRAALGDPKKKKKKKNMQLHLSGAGDLLTDPSESQLRSLLSTLDNRVDLAKRKLAAMREDRRISTADTPSNEGLSVDAVSQITPHRVRAASTPEWVTGAQPDVQCSSSVNGWDTMAMEDDSTFEKFLLETILL